MIVGVPREIKDSEYRVAATPEGVRELVRGGHRVLVESGAGEGSALADDRFSSAGAEIVSDADDVWGAAEMVLKVKEPQKEEFIHLRSDLILFTYLHLAASEDLTGALAKAGTAAVAYETVESDGKLPLLAPMSEIAGRMAPHVGATYLERPRGGRGVLLGGASGVAPASVLVLGAGMAGTNAAWIAAGMEADVAIVDRKVEPLRFVDQIQRGRIRTVMSSHLTLEELVASADLVIGAVLIPGARAPKLVTEDMVKSMRTGAVIVDISIDQGGSIETAEMTTHSDPTYERYGVVHYAVGNMPGAVPNTSTYALTNVTLPYALEIANEGLSAAARRDPSLAAGINVLQGEVTNRGVAEAHGMAYAPVEPLLPPR
ncbi:MAG: alanine dehydrogenase [Actinomycetota bacterium]